jgi:hypothetical protein
MLGYLENVCEKSFTPRGASLLTRADELLDPSTGSWDEDLVRGIFFLEEDAEIVSSILVHEGMDDIQAWHYNKRSIHSKIGLQGLY